ncbi:MAG: hypothetical protein LAT68_16865, partial [Cyclobacteriaceae bacterium]|nr:hypothetical protein [Cyclobacteriaceae bacterium]
MVTSSGVLPSKLTSWQASVNTQSLIASNGALAVSTARHLNGVNASLPLEKGNTYHIILNIDASTFEPQLEFGFWDGNRKLYEYYVHKSD